MTELVNPDELALVVSWTRPAGEGQVHFQTTVKQGISEEGLHDLVDKLHSAGRRAAVHSAIETAQSHLRKTDMEESQYMFAVQGIEERNKNKQQWLTEDKNAHAQALQGVALACKTRPKIVETIKALQMELFPEE